MSIAFNDELKLDRITKEVVRRISEEAQNGGDVVRTMQNIASRVERESVDPNTDFERLVGAFGSESQSLSYLNYLATVTSEDEEIKNALRASIKFAEKIRDNGISHVLEVIFERSHASVDKSEKLRNFVTAIYEKFSGRITYSNLNYDTLLLSALVNLYDSKLVDMGDGRDSRKKKIKPAENLKDIECNQLRDGEADFEGMPTRRLRLLHLHGSLTYWRTLDPEIHVKIATSALRELEPWAAMRKGEQAIRPDVVLANPYDKTEHITNHPFSLCYEMFEKGLKESNKWLIVGYSFRDEPVNSRLRKEFLSRNEKPTVLVVTFGQSPSRELIEQSLGWGEEDRISGSSDDWLIIDQGGANDMELRDEWHIFHSGNPPF